MGIKTVAVYSEADANSLHVRFADEAICVGPAPSAKSYLNIPQIMSAAEITGADGIHPGYGFLSENIKFAEICESVGVKFIGPKSHMIQKMGDKAFAKDTMKKAGVPVVPGSDGIVRDIKHAREIMKEAGLPVIIKATAGGGGRGMRIVREESEFENAYNTARAEAESAFGNPDVYIEKFIEKPRHIEIQLIGDQHGNVFHIGERDCSMQRRQQKLIEESPSPAVDEALRQKIGEAAVRGAKSVNYESVGTIEFLMDKEKNFYFMEMNTRIQVEHCVTEMVYGIDLIKWQIRVAAGEKLPFQQSDFKPRGHAIECRINAEDPDHNFRPSAGKIHAFHIPSGYGIRVDSHAYAEYQIPSNYDSMIGKLIVLGENRTEAISKMCGALDEFIIEGIKTTIPFQKRMMLNENFVSGDFDTKFVERLLGL
ncbi:MAG TPA: acetyl-CoA carboxylase biotin carboxylase subunit, partial [bacterium]|nr:acetyl-CoA carboxylase biotin carboxylase subunit [bacterium]